MSHPHAFLMRFIEKTHKVLVECAQRNTSPSVLFTQKRLKARTTSNLPWQIGKRVGYTPQNLTGSNRSFLKELTSEVFEETSPLHEEPWRRGEWTPDSIRTGVICKKIGVVPQWDKNGRRFMTTMLQVADNHVINYIDPERWVKTSNRGKKFGQGKYACLVVGADSCDPQIFTAGYRGLFANSGTMPKKRLHSFLITPNAAIEPGTPLCSTHFKIGQFVNVYGLTTGRGFQGVMKRWNFKGGPAGGPSGRGSSKFHRRPGSIGSEGASKVWPGRRLPGHMGMNFSCQRGVKEPHFPTHFPKEEADAIPEEYFDPNLFCFNDESITFSEVKDDFSTSRKTKKQAKSKK